MKRFVIPAVLALAACDPAPTVAPQAPDGAVVRIALPDEPAAPWTDAPTVDRACTACHSAEMIATQPPLAPEKWQATIEKMRTVYKAQIPTSDDAALIAELTAIGTARRP